jgi:transmembrane sensor
MTTPQHIAQLMYRHLYGTITEPEATELNAWVNESEDRRVLFAEVNDNKQLGETIAMMHPDEWERIDANIARKIREGIQVKESVDAIQIEEDDVREEEGGGTPRVHRVHFLKRSWWKYAAAIILLFGVGTYIYINNQNEEPSVTQKNPNPVQNDVAPGGNRATLTLADGSKIILDSAKQGTIAKETNATIIKTAEGKIEYKRVEERVAAITLNTMATPRGGQYQLTLPDGSQVWLNAESSITYPTAFSGNERKVSITGEAYFEVTKDKTKKFIVDVDGHESVEVLGTHFNINAYREENIIATTLIEGAIRLSANARTSNLPGTSVHTSLILKPGQQGQLTDLGLSLADHPDLEQVMAWKNGLFQYERTDIQSIMRQVERWYDVEVIYEEQIGDVDFTGGIARSETVSKLLAMLEKTGAIHFKIEGKKIYVRK